MSRRFILILCLFCLAGAEVLYSAPVPGVWIDVPFVAQTKEGCGSAAISMILQYWEQKNGRAVPASASPENIQTALFSRAAGGIPASSMQNYLKSFGYRVFAFQSDWMDLKLHIEKGRPLIVGLQPSGARGPLHYVVVVGIDTEQGYIFVNDPAEQKMLRISREGFASQWNPMHNWTLLAMPQPRD